MVFEEIKVGKTVLARDYMGLLGAFGVHIPTKKIPDGRYRISDVLNRWRNLKYRCHRCNQISEFRGKDNKCQFCGTERRTRRFRRFRKALLWFSLRYLRRWVTFTYLKDDDAYLRCPECGTYLKGFADYDDDYDDDYGEWSCNRCGYEDYPWYKEENKRDAKLIKNAIWIDDELNLLIHLFETQSSQVDWNLKKVLDKVIGHDNDAKPIKEIPFETPYYESQYMRYWNPGIDQLEREIKVEVGKC